MYVVGLPIYLPFGVKKIPRSINMHSLSDNIIVVILILLISTEYNITLKSNNTDITRIHPCMTFKFNIYSSSSKLNAEN